MIKNATFPTNLTEEQLTDMFFLGVLKAVCSSCKHINTIGIEEDTFICKGCKASQGNPCLNPDEVTKNR